MWHLSLFGRRVPFFRAALTTLILAVATPAALAGPTRGGPGPDDGTGSGAGTFHTAPTTVPEPDGIWIAVLAIAALAASRPSGDRRDR